MINDKIWDLRDAKRDCIMAILNLFVLKRK